ncbi:hypothetical protein Rfer_1175 [Rhodoferax ferrireducens T118]|uniref:Uncharacterized protein n=1 Tax=Albidiferax ferrireducens (strain ATCC BAA-621 / DSM 15236 / T118) TaxID=338969 RepID=Q21Z92_ALBFT|nr:hypothetical protein [Rhodoferax ferrireducens]ABD68911.1 hypothetical protein Rfer_1175 [Rhodoferax ferrireducens T118]
MQAGDLIVEHDACGASNQRIIFFDEVTDTIWKGSIAFITEQGQSRRAYCPQPKIESLRVFQKKIAENLLSCVPFNVPGEWSWTNKDFEARDLSILRRERRQRLKWKARRDQAFELIKPLVTKYTIDDILHQSLHLSWPARRARELGMRSSRDIYCALHKYLTGLGNKNALLPAYGNCGGAGKQKFFTTPPGKISGEIINGFNSDKLARIRMGLGWKKHKKEGVSVRVAYDRFLNEFYASQVCWKDSMMKVILLPPDQYPSEYQFAEWGPRYEGNMSAKSVNDGETSHRKKVALRSGQSRTSVISAGLLGQIDTTPCDQNLVSESSRLKILRTPYKAELADSFLGYIYGIHVGFEHPCTTTNLLAILNGASSKVEFCARYGINIREHEWISLTPRRILGDNGEMKSETGLISIEEMEASIEFCESYFGERKAVLESSNHRGHVHNDHLIPGSNKGRQTKRGEKPPGLDACFTFQEYMPLLIQSILYRNNEEIIPYPLIEMRKDGVRPVRIEMMKWCIEKGYVASTPTDIDALRVRCLPRLKAVLHADGVHLFDPTSAYECLIPSLRYSSQWLHQSGALERAHTRRRRLEVHVNPSNLQEIWLNLDGLRPLQIQTRDPYMAQVTLYDWLSISSDDKVKNLLSRQEHREYHVGRIATIDHVAKKARKEKKQEFDALDKKPSKASQLKGKRQNTHAEMLAQGLFPKPMASQQLNNMKNEQVVPATLSAQSISNPSPNPVRDLLRQLRRGHQS